MTAVFSISILGYSIKQWLCFWWWISRDLLFRTRTAWEDTWMQLELCTKEDSTVLVIPFLMSPLKDIDMLLCGMERGSWMELLPLHPPSRRSSRVVVISIIRH